jgi:hypothetical protein
LADAHVPAVYPAKGFVPSRGAVESQRMSESPLPDSNRRPLPYHDSVHAGRFGVRAAGSRAFRGALAGVVLRSCGAVCTRGVPGRLVGRC